jgi:hypothetical protein
MQLEWIERDPTDCEGEKYHVHYLIDAESDQCFATIANPRKGNILFETDLKIRGYDRSFITIDAAKGYAEWSAMRASFEDAKDLAKEFEGSTAEELAAKLNAMAKVEIRGE